MSQPRIYGSKKGKILPNPSRSKPVSENQAKVISDSQIWLKEFRPDYDQVIKRISKAPTGLYHGSPPGPAS